MKFESVFKTASAAFALVPGIGIMLANIGLPPGVSNLLFGAVVESMGVLTFLLLTASDKQIQKMLRKRVLKITVGLFAVFLLLLFTYLYLFDSFVITTPSYEHDSVLFPLWNSNELHDLISASGSKWKAMDDYGPQALRDLINETPNALHVTKIVFCSIYLLIFEFLILSFGLIGINVSDKAAMNKNESALETKSKPV